MDPVSDPLEGFVPKSFVFSAVGVFATRLPKSNAPLGVFAAFEAPKDANAPEPNPKALEAPAVGEAREPVEGGSALKGFLLL